MSTAEIIALIGVVFASTGFWSFLQFIIGKASRKKFTYQDVEEFRNGLCALLRNEIVVAHRTYSEKGFCSIEDKRNIAEMYQAYHNLGGNDIATALKNQILELPNEESEVS